MKRVHFFKDRTSDYFTESGLNKQIGASKSKWGLTLVKELIDNGLDATEKAGVDPYITVTIDHDFDLAGLNILKVYHTDTKNYRFQEDVSVIDIGLRFDDVQAMDLKSEPVSYGKKKNPRQEVLNAGGTDAEADFLVRERKGNIWYGERVEINAMDSRTMLDFLEREFKKHGIKKVVPDADTLKKRFKDQCRSRIVEMLSVITGQRLNG